MMLSFLEHAQMSRERVRTAAAVQRTAKIRQRRKSALWQVSNAINECLIYLWA
jgi:vacuolar-type H+-ATPase subunit E/Vma4